MSASPATSKIVLALFGSGVVAVSMSLVVVVGPTGAPCSEVHKLGPRKTPRPANGASSRFDALAASLVPSHRSSQVSPNLYVPFMSHRIPNGIDRGALMPLRSR